MDINVTTYLNSLGYGLAGLNILKAIARLGHTPALWVNGHGECPREDEVFVTAALERAAAYNPDGPSLRVAHQWDHAHRVGRGTHAGLTFFELDRLTPREVHSLSNLDVVFVPSYWAADVLVRSGVPEEKVNLARLGVDAAIFHPDVAPLPPEPHRWLGDLVRQDGPTVFLNCGKWEVRKGHDVMLSAFREAFAGDDNVLLVMNCHNPFLSGEQHNEWVRMYGGGSRCTQVVVIEDRLSSQRDVAALMAFADCGVFPSRGEGWNLELLEMMAMGKHVIATDYSAHTEFCTADNCLLIEVGGVEPAYDGVFFRDGCGNWASLGEPQVEQLASHMREVHRRKQAGELSANEAGVETGRRLSWENTARDILSVLQ